MFIIDEIERIDPDRDVKRMAMLAPREISQSVMQLPPLTESEMSDFRSFVAACSRKFNGQAA